MNHNKNECEYIRVKCKFCNNEFIKKEIKSHEQKCELCKKDKEKIDYDNDKIDLKEYLRGLSKNWADKFRPFLFTEYPELTIL